MTAELIDLPDGSVMEGPLYGAQMPRLYVEPERHSDLVAGCVMCALEEAHSEAGCGDRQALEALDWAEGYGYELDPWQRWCLVNMMSTLPNGRWAAPDNLLVISRQNGKGTILEVRELAGLFVFQEKLIIHTSHQFKTSVNHFKRLQETLSNNRALMRRVRRIAGSHGEESIELYPLPSMIFGSSSRHVRIKESSTLAFHARQGASGSRGFTCNTLVYDEAMVLSSEVVGASLPTMSAVPNPQVITAGSAGLKDSFAMAKSRKKMLRQAPRMFAAEWSAVGHNEDCPKDLSLGRETNNYVVCTDSKHQDRDDPRTWARNNPAFGYRISIEFTRDQELDKMDGVEFDRERLGIGEWPAEDEAWAVVSKDKWRSLANTAPGFPSQPIAFAADIDEDGNFATITAAWSRGWGKGNPIVIEIPKNCSRAGADWVMTELDRLYRKWNPVGIGIPKSGPAAALLEDGKKKWRDKLVEIGPGEEAAAFAWFMQQVKAGTLSHFGEADAPTLWHAMGRAQTRVMGDGGKTWSRRDSESDITPCTSGNHAAYVFNKNFRNYDLSNTVQ